MILLNSMMHNALNTTVQYQFDPGDMFNHLFSSLFDPNVSREVYHIHVILSHRESAIYFYYSTIHIREDIARRHPKYSTKHNY